jgi:hypothetical protein
MTALLLLSLASGARADPGNRVTPKEREKALKLIHQLEADPFGKKARDARRWLALWMVDGPDRKVQYCPEVLGGTLQERRRVRNEIVAQITYSGLAFLLEHPGTPAASFDIHRAGVLGAIRAYEVMVAGEPGTRSPLFDGLVAKRNEGTLDAYLAETVKACPR